MKISVTAVTMTMTLWWMAATPVAPNAQQTTRGQRITTEARPQIRRLVPQTRTAQPSLRHVFELTAENGNRDVIDITLSRAGTVVIQAAWRGSTEELAVILNGPGQTGYYAREDGRSPLRVEFEVTEDLLRRGRNWTVSIVNFSRRGRAVGRTVIDYPTVTVPIARLTPVLRRIGEATTDTPPPSAAPVRSILPDGRVQARYPDGRIVVYEAGCGFTTIMPDGTSSTATCNQVQPADLPALPSDPALVTFLEVHRDHLLQQISQLVDYRQDEVDLYLAYEESESDGVLEQIQMRTRLIDRLLE